MWDRPDILNRVANTLFVAAMLLAAYGALWWVVRLPVFALREVAVTGEAQHVTREQIFATCEIYTALGSAPTALATFKSAIRQP